MENDRQWHHLAVGAETREVGQVIEQHQPGHAVSVVQAATTDCTDLYTKRHRRTQDFKMEGVHVVWAGPGSTGTEVRSRIKASLGDPGCEVPAT